MPNQETTPEFVYIYDNQGNVKRVARDYVLRNGLERQILSLSDEERIGYDLGERLEGLEKNKYQGATREYYGACLRLARGETLTDDEAVGFRGAAVVLGHQSPAQIGLDIAEAKRIIQAQKWLQEHAHDAVEAAKLREEIAGYERELQDYLGRIRSRAAPAHERLAKLNSLIHASIDYRRVADAWSALLAGDVLPPPAGQGVHHARE